MMGAQGFVSDEHGQSNLLSHRPQSAYKALLAQSSYNFIFRASFRQLFFMDNNHAIAGW